MTTSHRRTIGACALAAAAFALGTTIDSAPWAPPTHAQPAPSAPGSTPPAPSTPSTPAPGQGSTLTPASPADTSTCFTTASCEMVAAGWVYYTAFTDTTNGQTITHDDCWVLEGDTSYIRCADGFSTTS